MLIQFLILAACFSGKSDDTGHDCGPGTHWDGQYCVPDEDTDTDTDADADTDTDTDTDTDADTDADTDTDTDADTDLEDADGDGFTVEEGDCDDGDATIHPDATEICENGVDDNCDGSANDCLWDDQYLITSEALTLAGDRAGERAGRAVEGGGDVNGDGRPDVLVGAPYSAEGAEDAGKVYLGHGPITADLSLSDSAAIFTGFEEEQRAGSSLAFVGDTNGDGYGDVLIGAPGHNMSGAAYLFYGPVSGEHVLTEADSNWTGVGSQDGAGGCVSALGDVNGDGQADFVVGAAYESSWAVDAGGAFVFYGPASSSGTISGANARIYGQAYGLGAGLALAGGGDLDGDGVGDLAVYHGATFQTVSVFSGPISGVLTTADADASVAGSNNYTRLSASEHSLDIAGDSNGDGYDDLLIGAPECQEIESGMGAVFLFEGPLSGATDSFLCSARFDGVDGSDRAGCAVAFTGDLDAGGGSDILIGARSANDTAANAGAAYLVTGPFGGTSSLRSARASFLGSGGEYVGYDVAAAGDLTGDGLLDLLVGASSADGDITGSGAAFLLASDGL